MTWNCLIFIELNILDIQFWLFKNKLCYFSNWILSMKPVAWNVQTERCLGQIIWSALLFQKFTSLQSLHLQLEQWRLRLLELWWPQSFLGFTCGTMTHRWFGLRVANWAMFFWLDCFSATLSLLFWLSNQQLSFVEFRNLLLDSVSGELHTWLSYRKLPFVDLLKLIKLFWGHAAQFSKNASFKEIDLWFKKSTVFSTLFSDIKLKCSWHIEQ